MNNPAEPLTIASLDLERYLGKWYEIARLPQRHEPAQPTTRQSFLDTAVQQGFDLSELIDTPQHAI